jgi:hypothetical protein
MADRLGEERPCTALHNLIDHKRFMIDRLDGLAETHSPWTNIIRVGG